MKRQARTLLTAVLLAAPTSLILTGCARSAPDSILAPTVQETPSPSSPAFAQAMRERAPFALLLQHRQELRLSEAQVAQIEAIRDRLQQQNQPLLAQLREAGVKVHGERTRAGEPRGQRMTRERSQETRERHRQMTPEQREEMRARMQERMQQMTPEQREQMRQRMQERSRQEGAQQRMRGMTSEQREQMRHRLEEMTPEQREQLRARLQEQRAQATPRARSAPERRLPENLRPVVQQLVENGRAAVEEVRAVLTPEQQTRLQELQRQQRRSSIERRGAAGGPRGPRGKR